MAGTETIKTKTVIVRLSGTGVVNLEETVYPFAVLGVENVYYAKIKAVRFIEYREPTSPSGNKVNGYDFSFTETFITVSVTLSKAMTSDTDYVRFELEVDYVDESQTKTETVSIQTDYGSSEVGSGCYGEATINVDYGYIVSLTVNIVNDPDGRADPVADFTNSPSSSYNIKLYSSEAKTYELTVSVVYFKTDTTVDPDPNPDPDVPPDTPTGGEIIPPVEKPAKGEISGTGDKETRKNEITGYSLSAFRNFCVGYDYGVVKDDDHDFACSIKSESSIALTDGMCFAYGTFGMAGASEFKILPPAVVQYHIVYVEFDKTVIPNTCKIKIKNNQSSPEVSPTTFRRDNLLSVKTGIFQFPLWLIEITNAGIQKVEDLRALRASIQRSYNAFKVNKGLGKNVTCASTEALGDNSKLIASTKFVARELDSIRKIING